MGILRKIFKKKTPDQIAKKFSNTNFDPSTVLLKSTTFKNPYDNKITIGKDCMIGCNFIFESKEGEIEIGNGVFINAGTNLISRTKICIGNDVTIAWGCSVYDHNSHSIDWRERVNDLKQQISDYKTCGDFIKNKNWTTVKSRSIIIQDKVWIGFDSLILNGVTIGEGAIIGAKSVIRDDVEPWTVVAGNPATIIKRLRNE